MYSQRKLTLRGRRFDLSRELTGSPRGTTASALSLPTPPPLNGSRKNVPNGSFKIHTHIFNTRCPCPDTEAAPSGSRGAHKGGINRSRLTVLNGSEKPSWIYPAGMNKFRVARRACTPRLAGVELPSAKD
ncbi:hypothetical protein PISMIDRAFT_20039 [Pisolithus microcarpus 441]|uniref:Uncharacterized protein n=1 Tax=Pisolithus microcarpus 441 TaxID=765257 RepID=A0A0C9Y9V2_9AGAM|nr:hypothetical protein PISMIDRAFT_20039 [Pisolithus microcarpus 441]